jgi:hypothetical protein
MERMNKFSEARMRLLLKRRGVIEDAENDDETEHELTGIKGDGSYYPPDSWLTLFPDNDQEGTFGLPVRRTSIKSEEVSVI